MENNISNHESRGEIDAISKVQFATRLCTQTVPTLLAGWLVSIFVIMAMYGQVDNLRLAIWGGVISLLTLIRIVANSSRRKREITSVSSVTWLRRYLFSSMAGGFAWAALILFFSESIPVSHQLLILVILTNIPIAAMPTNAIYLPVFYAFSAPIFITLLIWTLIVDTGLGWNLFAVAVAYFTIIIFMANLYHNNLRKTIEIDVKNQGLIKALSTANQQLEKMAYYDPLTGLGNRHWLQEESEKALERCKRHGSQMALILIDLDNFKEVNDRFGHEAGDRLLVTVADRISRSLRQTDTVMRVQGGAARLGGDEFTLLLEDINGEVGAEQTAQRIIENVCQPSKLFNNEIIVTASVGIALYPQSAQQLGTLVRYADIAMYQAKQAGKNQYRIYESHTV